MNKKFSTLLTMGLLMAGALFSSANAQTNPFKAFPAGAEIKDGVKVYLAVEEDGTNGALASKKVVDGVYTLEGKSVATDGSVFVIDGVKKQLDVLTFQLKDTDGNLIAVKADGDVATSKDEAVANIFYVEKDKDLSDADAIHVLNADGTKLLTLNSGTYAFAATGSYDVKFFAPVPKEVTANDLNANLSGQGFKLSFPNATSEPDVNPFDVQIVAVTMEAYNGSASSEAGVENVEEGTYFAVAKGKELNAAIATLAAARNSTNQAALTKAWKEATFIALDPNANFGITGLVAASGEGYGFVTVKGDKLVKATDANVKKDGKINIKNAIFEVTEEDELNAPGEYTIAIPTGAKVEGDKSTATSAAVYVGAYSLTTGGVKTYITTVLADKQDKLSLAQTSSSTWAKASDLLKADDATVVTISFLGTKPADATEAGKSLYGKELVPVYGTSNFAAAVNAPKDVDINNPLSQWVITGVSGHNFTFTNRETNVTFTTSLYKTDKAGEYVIGSTPTMDGGANITSVTGVTGDLATISKWKGQTIKLTAATVSEGSLTLSDSQLQQASSLVFNGTGTVTVEKIYMAYDAKASGSPFFVPSQKADEALVWLFEKGEAVKNTVKYAYLKEGEVATKDSAMNQIQSYLLYTKDNNGVKQYLAGIGNDENYEAKADDAQRYYFKKNVNGTYALIALDKTAQAKEADKYKEVIKGDAVKYSVDPAASKFINTVKLNEGSYADVTVDFNSFTESLESVARHATFNGGEGFVSMKMNKNGILEGVIAGEAMTFWLDTADVDQDIPSFYISVGNPETKAAEEVAATRNFLYYAADSLTYWDPASATYKENANYKLDGSDDTKAIFRPASIAGIDTISTVVDGKDVLVADKAEEGVCLSGVKNFKFYIMEAGDNYVIRPLGATNHYLYNLNGKLGFTDNQDIALAVAVGQGESPVANEAAPSVSTVKVVATEGGVQIVGAQGKNVVITNVLGQTIANTVVSSDAATIAAPAGVVIVAVEGEAAVKAIVK